MEGIRQKLHHVIKNSLTSPNSLVPISPVSCFTTDYTCDTYLLYLRRVSRMTNPWLVASIMVLSVTSFHIFISYPVGRQHGQAKTVIPDPYFPLPVIMIGTALKER
jgi:hypothetical protein